MRRLIWVIRILMSLVIGGGLWWFTQSESVFEFVFWGSLIVIYPTVCVLWMKRLEQIIMEDEEQEQIRSGIGFPPS